MLIAWICAISETRRGIITRGGDSAQGGMGFLCLPAEEAVRGCGDGTVGPSLLYEKVPHTC